MIIRDLMVQTIYF